MGAVRQVFEWATIDGRPFVIMEKWLVSLTEQEQQQFQEARHRQDVYRQQAIDAGLMRREWNEYVWRDQDAAAQGKACDKVWLAFFQRWQKECGIVFTTRFIEE